MSVNGKIGEWQYIYLQDYHNKIIILFQYSLFWEKPSKEWALFLIFLYVINPYNGGLWVLNRHTIELPAGL
jgi:hypothetical protein